MISASFSPLCPRALVTASLGKNTSYTEITDDCTRQFCDMLKRYPTCRPCPSRYTISNAGFFGCEKTETSSYLELQSCLPGQKLFFEQVTIPCRWYLPGFPRNLGLQLTPHNCSPPATILTAQRSEWSESFPVFSPSYWKSLELHSQSMLEITKKNTLRLWDL